MHTVYRVWRKSNQCGGYKEGDVFDTPAAAAAATTVPNLAAWRQTGDGWGCDTVADGWLIVGELAPDTDGDRIALAVSVALQYARNVGDHHKLWVIDQMLRHLTGDRYATVVGDGWDTGTAP
jgi:hypothetical protein